MFLACFSVAEVLSVSTVVVEGRAVVMVVSCGPASVVAVVSWVSKSPCHCVLSAKKFTPHGLVWARSPAEGVSPFVYGD